MNMKRPSTSTSTSSLVVLHIQRLHGCSFQGFTGLLRQRRQLYLVPSARRRRQRARGGWGRSDGGQVDLLLRHVGGHGSQVTSGFRFHFFVRGIPSHGEWLGRGCYKKSGKDVDGRKEGKRVEILEWIPIEIGMFSLSTGTAFLPSRVVRGNKPWIVRTG